MNGAARVESRVESIQPEAGARRRRAAWPFGKHQDAQLISQAMLNSLSKGSAGRLSMIAQGRYDKRPQKERGRRGKFTKHCTICKPKWKRKARSCDKGVQMPCSIRDEDSSLAPIKL